MTDYINSKLIIETSKIEEGSVAWRSPSNLAIIKYWGKHGNQLPNNPSISFTLDKAYTETTLEYRPKSGADKEEISLSFLFEGKEKPAFETKIKDYLKKLTEVFPFLKQLHLTIKSKNSFPHSAGIASSASSMSALALCLCSLEDVFFGTLENDKEYRQKASFVARLGSGSACRSIYATAAEWGATGEIENSSDLYAIPFEDKIHEVFKNFHDDILIISQGEKKVSSTAGHGLMDGNIYAENRYQQARQRLHQLLNAMQQGDLEAFGRIAESEALTLHALMMSSNPPYILLKPNTLLVIDKIHQYRKDTGNPLYFSLDAGPNPHLLYPDKYQQQINSFIQEELKPFCENENIIEDMIGKGPLQL